MVLPLAVSLSLESAEIIASEALTAARQAELLALTVVVLDAGGNLITAKREDGCGVLRFDIAFGKAWGALGMGIPSRTIRDRLGDRPVFQGALATASDGRLIPVPGGVLIRDREGFVIGAVGISGDTSAKDEFAAIVGVQASGYTSEPPEPEDNWQGSNL